MATATWQGTTADCLAFIDEIARRAGDKLAQSLIRKPGCAAASANPHGAILDTVVAGRFDADRVDAIQEAWLSVRRIIEEGRLPVEVAASAEKLRNYFLVAVSHKEANARRRSRKEMQPPKDQDMQVVSDALSPGTQLEQEETHANALQALKDCIDKLKDRDRRILTALYLDGHTREEISRLESIPEGLNSENRFNALNKMLERARERVRVCLEHEKRVSIDDIRRIT